MSEENTTTSSTSSTEATTSSENWRDSTDPTDEDLFDDVKEARKTEVKPQVKQQPKRLNDAETKEEAKEEAKAKRYIKTKVNGREESVDEETLIREYQKSRAGDERLAKATQIEKNTQAFLKALQEDPEQVLNDPRLSIDRQKLALKWLQSEVEAELEDPREREYKSQAEELKAYKERETNAKQQAEEAEHNERRSRAVQERTKHFQDTFSKALELSPLSKDPETAAAALRDMALQYRLAKQQGYEATPEELADHVQSKQMKAMYSAASTFSGEDLIGFLGEAVVNKIRKADLARIQGKLGGGSPTQSSDWKVEPRKQTSSKTIDPSDFRMKLRDDK